MKLPRWLMGCLMALIALAVLTTAWWWIIWPEQTARQFIGLVSEARFEDANQLMRPPARWVVEKYVGHDATMDEEIHFRVSLEDSTGELRMADGDVFQVRSEYWQDRFQNLNLCAAHRPTVDVVAGRRRFLVLDETSPFLKGNIEFTAERGTVSFRIQKPIVTFQLENPFE